MRCVFVLTLILLATIAAFGQAVGQNASLESNQNKTIRVNTRMVIEAVSVTDKNGRPVAGLTARDFRVTEDGVPQTISFCEYQQLLGNSVPGPKAAPPEQITIYDTLTRTQIAPEPPDSLNYKDRRLLAFYFDMTAMPPGDQLRALEAAETFVRKQMQPHDLIAIFRYQGGSVDVLTDFTADRDRLLSILETMVVGEGQGFGESTPGAGAADTGAAFGQDDSEFNTFNNDRQLSALQTAAKMLGRLSEKKSLIYFASGLRLNGLDNQAQLHATIDEAIRSGVSFWPIDARGLVAEAPLGDATQGSQGSVVMYSGAAARSLRTDFQQSQDTLYAIAGDTGGKALFDYNDLTRGIEQAQRAVSSYYILGYYTTNAALDGKFRRVKISLNTDSSASLDYRQGYYAQKKFSRFTEADKERQLEDALMLPDPITELTIAMEVDYFQLNRAEYFVPFIVKIPGRELALAKRHGAEHTLLDFIGEIKDNYGTTITNLRDKMNIKLSDATATELAKRPIEYDAGFTLLPGKYTIKFLARDAETGRIGTYETDFVIPDLNRAGKEIPISSVVLSSQRVELANALFNAVKNKEKREQEEAANPLVQNGRKLIPSVTRVFSNKREIYVYLQAYEQGVPSIEPLISFVTLYRAQDKVLETRPVEFTEDLNKRLNTIPLAFRIGLGRVPVGEYDCQVSVLDPMGNKVAFWRAPIRVVP
jgi:VWFA-related protein